jgi:hypothetical protein
MFRPTGLPIPLEGVDRVQSACNMPYDYVLGWLGPRMRAKRDRNGYLG